MELVLLATLFCLTGRSEIAEGLDAQYGIGPAVENYARRSAPAELWQVGATVGPVAQVIITRRIVFEYRF